MIEYREAFVKSLRGYNRPTSSYTKMGGKSYGLKKTPALTTGTNFFNGDSSSCYGETRTT